MVSFAGQPHSRQITMPVPHHSTATFYEGQQLPSMLCHCWLGVRKSIQPVKRWVMRLS